MNHENASPEVPIPEGIDVLYASTRGALCYDLVKFRNRTIPVWGHISYGESSTHYREALDEYIECTFAGNPFNGTLPEGTFMGPDFISGFVRTLSSMGYSPAQQRAFLDRIFAELESSGDPIIGLQARLAGDVANQRFYEKVGWYDAHPEDRP